MEGIGRVAERERPLAGGLDALLSRFGYADLVDATATPVVPVAPVAPGPPTGMLGRSEALARNLRIAGTEIALGAKQLIESSTDLGLDERESTFDYDDRARLKTSVLLRREGESVAEPRAENAVTEADLREARTIAPPRLTASAVDTLGAIAESILPLSWKIEQANAAYQVESRSFSGAPSVEDQSFGWTGGRRVSDETWTATYDARGRLVAQESADRRITYDYDPTDRLVGRTAWQKSADAPWSLETRTNVLARDALPAATTYVWDPVVDRLIAVYDSAVVVSATAAGNAVTHTGLVRQYVHGDQAYDDPIEVLVARTAGEAPTRYLPILDEAGTGSLQAVLDDDGYLVERVLYADAYGDAPRYLQGAVVERVAVRREGDNRVIRVDFSEILDAATLAQGVTLEALAADGAAVRQATTLPVSVDETALEWTLTSAEWSTFTDGATSVEVTVSDALRFKAWGNRPLQPVAEWETLLGRSASRAATPFAKRAALEQFDSNGVLYDLPDLYLVGRTEPIAPLHFDFHALPLRDPATKLLYVRARWYDSSTGSFLTPDPMGYEDASNLYQYASNDPVNFIDPTGMLSWRDAGEGALGFLEGAGSGAAGLVRGTVEAVVGVGKASYYASGALLYATTGGEQYREQSETFHQAVDSIKQVVENPGVIVTAVAAQIDEAKAIIQSGDAREIGKLGGKTAFAIAEAVITKKVGTKFVKAARVVKAADEGADVARQVRTAERVADISSDSRRATRAMKAESKADDIARIRAQKINCVTPCFAAGTLVAMASGFESIEDVRVGDRVETTKASSGRPDGWTEVDPVNWHLVTLRMPDTANGGEYEIEMLRPLEWVLGYGAFPGEEVALVTQRSDRDPARVVAVGPSPEITSGPGRVVLSTFTHVDQLLEMRVERSDEVLHPTPSHLFYSIDRNGWVAAGKLSSGERIRTRDGETRIESIEPTERRERVFDIEVEEEHAFYVGDARVFAHNCPHPQAERLEAAKGVSGIYHLKNRRTGEEYIGSSVDIGGRLLQGKHRSAQHILKSGDDIEIAILEVDIRRMSTLREKSRALRVIEQKQMNVVFQGRRLDSPEILNKVRALVDWKLDLYGRIYQPSIVRRLGL